MSRVLYTSIVRSLMFTIICTRLDNAQALGAVNWYMLNHGGEHWKTVKKILRYIRETWNTALCFR